MKHKLKNPPKFFAFYHHYSDDHLSPYNVLSESLLEDMLKAVGKKYYDLDKNKYDYLDTREKFINKLKHEFMYRYWGKCEWEFIVSNWVCTDFEQKVDVWAQLEPNVEVIADLIINSYQIDFEKIQEKNSGIIVKK